MLTVDKLYILWNSHNKLMKFYEISQFSNEDNLEPKCCANCPLECVCKVWKESILDA